ncbi:hypothetical protein HOB10_00715 [Candidatus Parcubacteria bacterium]|jgi:hypothetical protein|nr:hypothetical protein [Candidatus Parcubacteria bacterium]
MSDNSKNSLSKAFNQYFRYLSLIAIITLVFYTIDKDAMFAIFIGLPVGLAITYIFFIGIGSLILLFSDDCIKLVRLTSKIKELYKKNYKAGWSLNVKCVPKKGSCIIVKATSIPNFFDTSNEKIRMQQQGEVLIKINNKILYNKISPFQKKDVFLCTSSYGGALEIKQNLKKGDIIQAHIYEGLFIESDKEESDEEEFKKKGGPHIILETKVKYGSLKYRIDDEFK